ncbi:hypothetical protein [Shewanella sp. cp20]|uniref:hypothetical protein n=1 Tax=Shewanella sp. cp20 TaxID=1521167 RepID=UPI0005A2AACF|nr:hypothetical protein [Shewanella sp. cp20]KIO38301.1 hypothetical protein DB48_01775 [Shewanella sp. cp20]
MKKITKKQRQRDVLYSLQLRKSYHPSKQSSKKGEILIANQWIKENQRFIRQLDKKRKTYSIEFPEEVNFSSAFVESVQPINAIRKLIELDSKKHRLKSINMNNINGISTPASLVLTAEIDKWNDKVGRKLVPQTEEWTENVKAQLSDLGFFELFNFDKCKVTTEPSTLNIVKFIKGAPGDEKKAKILREKIEEIVGNRVKRPPLFQALSEAITNVTHHAYPKTYRSKKHWYMTASFCNESRRLKVAFYDQGIGIPSSLPRSNLWERAKAYMNRLNLYNDHPSLIEAAVEMGRTQTDRENRGKGLQDLLEFIKQYGNGYMSILSQKGLYKFTCENRSERTKKESLKYPILGTLIIWSVIVPEKGGAS